MDQATFSDVLYTYTAIPEPSTLALVAISASVVLLGLKRRRC